jgi:predicted dehydrogenase
VASSSIGIGLIGCGFIGRFHSIAIRSLIKQGLIEAEYRAVCDLDLSRAQSFADVAGVPVVTTDWRDVIDSRDVNVVYICVPTASHKELVLRAAERGKHVFCEKPIATNLVNVEEMVAAVKRAGVNAGVGMTPGSAFADTDSAQDADGRPRAGPFNDNRVSGRSVLPHPGSL